MNIKERKAIIAGNWKLNKRVAEIPAFAQELQANLPAERCCDVVICAPYPLIGALEAAGQCCALGVGAQDVSEHQHGAYTGEVSAEQLSDLGAQYCIVGHSERRSYHGETDLQVNAKTKILLENHIIPIICVGESLAQREHDLTANALARVLAVPHVHVLGTDKPEDHNGIITFTVDGVHPHDISEILASDGVAIRAGHHCAQPLLAYLKHPSTARASLAFYNTESEVDRLLDSISTLRERMGYGK